jgi:predicted GNAT family N-acyltransferase
MNVKIVETEEELQQAYDIRMVVFVEEQKVPPEEEIDDLEGSAIHFIGYDKGKPVAASRLRFVEEYGKLERICVLEDARGKSFGKEMIEAMEQVVKEKGFYKAKLNAQTQAEGFYEKLGYHTVSGEFMDAGIPHVTMVKDL